VSTTTPSTPLRWHVSDDPRFGTGFVVAVVVVLVGFVPALTVAVLVVIAGGREVEAGSAGPLVWAMPPIILLGGLCIVGLVTAVVLSVRVAELRELDEARTDLLATVSHELRTPLTSILACAEILGQHRDGGDHHRGDTSLDDEAVRVITRTGRRMLALTEDLLALSWAETGSHDPAMEPCEVDVLVASVLETLSPSAAEKRMRILVGPGPTPAVTGDRRQLERVLVNVVGNAVKFSPTGTDVRISTVLDADYLEIRVRDQGIGIPADELGHVFERFSRGRRAEHQSIGGTGLGLAIVAEVVERHGGWVSIDSAEGIGTTVGIHLRTAVLEPARRELQAVRS
jgi:signal transduction histidine kinase